MLSSDLFAEDDVLPIMRHWQRSGLRTALVTLVDIDGASPRPLGAQMAVAEDGTFCGYLSGGCLESAVALQACDTIKDGKNRLERYGRGSKYFDIQLPCGSGLALYFDQAIDPGLLQQATKLISQRKRFVLKTLLTQHTTTLLIEPSETCREHSTRHGDEFFRLYQPKPRLLLLGTGPTVSALAALAKLTGFDIDIWSPDRGTHDQLVRANLACLATPQISDNVFARIDAATAVVLAFHEHDIEPQLLERLLPTEAFYIGVLGNRGVHQQRLRLMQERGYTDSQLARIHGPIGSIPGAKSKATLGISILAELMREAKARNLVA